MIIQEAKREDPMRRLNEHLLQFLEHLQVEIAAQKLLLAELERKFDPNQPRVPAGSSEGGRWAGADAMAATRNGRSARVLDPTGTAPWRDRTDAFGADGRLEAQAVMMRDGTAIGSEFNVDGLDARHVVALPGGRRFTFENDGAIQTVRGADGAVLARSALTAADGVVSEPTAQLASSSSLRDAQRAALALFNSPGRGGAAIFGFPATDSPEDAIPHVRELTQAEMARACPGYGTVQALTTTAAASIRREDYRNEGAYGTAVHRRVRDAVNGEDRDYRNPIDPNFRAEMSVTKDGRIVTWGQSGTVRVDVYENVPNGPICVYDIKTGRNGLAPEHVEEIFMRAYSIDGNRGRPINIATVRP